MATSTRVQRGTRTSELAQPCVTCKEVKSAVAFATREGGRRQSQCRACKNARRRDRRRENPERTKRENRSTNIRRHRGMTEALFDRMFVEQQGRCGMCSQSMRADGKKCASSAHIDHNHTTGKVRELLCHRCNTGFGLFDEDVEVLSMAIAYALRHQVVTTDSFTNAAVSGPIEGSGCHR
jgi:hypothetical protein